MPRALFLSHRIPYPPDKGERVRAYHEIEALAGAFDVTVASLSHDAADGDHVEGLVHLTDQIIMAPAGGKRGLVRGLWQLARGRSVTEGYFASPAMSALVAEDATTGPYDLAFGYCTSVLPLLMQVPARVKVLDFVDVDSAKWDDYARSAGWLKRQVYRREAAGVRRLERRAVDECDAVFVVSPREAELIEGPREKIHPVVNGVDTSYFDPGETGPGDDEGGLVFTGTMDYKPNVEAVVWFVRNVFGKLKAEFPELTFDIVGRDPTPAVRQLSAVEGVTVTGSVPDVRPYLKKARVAVVPLTIARGIQNKVLEAMAMGKATVLSKQALEGIEATPGESVLTAEDEDQWTRAVVHLLEEKDRRKLLGERARQVVVDAYSWEARLAPMVELCTTLVESAP